MPQSLAFTPTAEELGDRLDKVLTSRLTEFSRVRIQQLIKQGQVLVNGKVGKPAYRLEAGDQVVVHMVEAILVPDNSADTRPESIPLDVLYEDEQMAAIHKPADMVVHPAAGHTSGTLVNALLARWPQLARVGGEGRAGIVHRLDKDTSGVILVAKTEPTRLALMQQFASRAVKKRYLALVEGLPRTPVGEINAPIGRDPQHRKRMTVLASGRPAITTYAVLSMYASHALLECFPLTGRTHQIRVHLAFIGHPVAGDTVYGRRKPSIRLTRHFLHAESITLTLPGTDHRITISAPLPDELQHALDQLAMG